MSITLKCIGKRIGLSCSDNVIGRRRYAPQEIRVSLGVGEGDVSAQSILGKGQEFSLKT